MFKIMYKVLFTLYLILISLRERCTRVRLNFLYLTVNFFFIQILKKVIN